MIQQNTQSAMNQSINLKNQTLLGSLVQVLMKFEEGFHTNSTTNNENAQKALENQILAELEKKNYALEKAFTPRIDTNSALGQNMCKMITNLESNKDHTIFYLMAHSHALDFLYSQRVLKELLTETNFSLIFKVNGNSQIKETTFFNTNHAMNIALVKNNEAFIDFFTPFFLQFASTQMWRESVKIALNYGNQKFLNSLNEEQTLFLQNLKNANGRNATYYVRTFEMLDYLENKFHIKPSSPQDWFEKNIYHYLDLSNSLANPQGLGDKFIALAQEAAKRKIDIEHFVLKPQKKELKSPPLWLLINQLPELLPSLAPYMSSHKTDSAGSNFIFFLFNTFKKQAPDTKKSFEQLASLENLIQKDSFNLEHKNNYGLCALDMLKETIGKETKMRSVRLENYKKFCEKILLLHISKSAKPNHLIESPSQYIKKIKI